MKTLLLEFLSKFNPKHAKLKTALKKLGIYHELLSTTPFIPNTRSSPLETRIYCVLNDITSSEKLPKCCICKKPIFRFISTFTTVITSINDIGRFSLTCSHQCAKQTTQATQKRQKTCLEKYGVNVAAKSACVKNKTKQTNMQRYGVKQVFQIPNVKKQIKQTNLDRYGFEHACQSQKIKNLTKHTCLEKYGTEYALQSKDVRDKINATNLRRYGVKNVLSAEIVKNKIKQTNLTKFGNVCSLVGKDQLEKRKKTWIKKYGVDHPMKNPLVQEKRVQKCLRKYGVENCLLLQQIKDKRKHTQRIKGYETIIKHLKSSVAMFSKDEYINSTKSYPWKCLKCGNIFIGIFDGNNKDVFCPTCYPIQHSKFESKIVEILQPYFNNIKYRSREEIKPYELDIVIPSKHVAIECHGLYWHSEKIKTNSSPIATMYHLNKLSLCKKADIKLIQIFEDEFINHPKIVKFRLLHILGCIKRKIFARKCEIKEIDTKIKTKFLNKYHIQGNDISCINLGAIYKNKLVAIMTFSKRRIALGGKHVENDYELSRFCTLFNFNVIGIAGKLLSYFEKTYNPNKIISYADRRWSAGNLYIRLGFTLHHISSPNYWYLINNYRTRVHRFGYRKNILKDKLSTFDPNLTEWQNMQANGFDRIWDCGNLVFIKKY
jgi:G:T-mismatch repair DNA endonuclease (very short patch repair protein)